MSPTPHISICVASLLPARTDAAFTSAVRRQGAQSSSCDERMDSPWRRCLRRGSMQSRAAPKATKKTSGDTHTVRAVRAMPTAMMSEQIHAVVIIVSDIVALRRLLRLIVVELFIFLFCLVFTLQNYLVVGQYYCPAMLNNTNAAAPLSARLVGLCYKT